MATLCSYECQDYNSFMFKLYSCYVHLLCSTFIYSYYVKKSQKHVKIILIKDQKQNKKFCEDENVQINFLGTKIKILYIYKDEKII